MVDIRHSAAGVSRKLHRLLPRRFHAFCVGAAKTGTTSVAAAFVGYRESHEPEVRETTRLVVAHLEGTISEAELRKELLARDARMRLELESAHPLAYLAGELASVFPDSRFVVTVREPLSWLKSRLNFHHQVHPPAWEEYREYFWTSRHHGFPPEEEALTRYGLCALEVYLSQYADHYSRVLEQLPAERFMVVRTEEINPQLAEIAEFVGADPKRLVPSHSKRSDDKITPLDELDEDYVRRVIHKHCGELIATFFPDRVDYYSLGR